MADTGSTDTATTDASSADGVGTDTAADSAGGSDSTKLIACLTKECNAEVVACIGYSDCLKAIGCLGGCKGDTTCTIGCATGLSSGAQQALLAAAQCGVQKGCIDVGGGGGGNKCGDGTCDLGEQFTCPADCPATDTCGNGKCDLGEQFTCAGDCPAAGSCGDGKCDLG